jgi:uncharacterized protein YaaN involved in tellurite resistance
MNDVAYAVQTSMEVEKSILTHKENEIIAKIKNSLNINDSKSVMQFGTQAQINISKFSDEILNEVKNTSDENVGNTLSTIMTKLSKFNIESLNKSTNLTKLPIIGFIFNESNNNKVIEFDGLMSSINDLIENLQRSKYMLMKDVIIQDGFYEENKKYIREIEYYILAGEEILNDLKNNKLKELQKNMNNSNNALVVEEYQDLIEKIDSLEHKLYDLKVSRMLSIQTLPQIRMIQKNNKMLVSKIDSSIMNTLPTWKTQFVIATSLFKQSNVIEMQKKVNKATNTLLNKNAENLKQNTMDIATQQNEAVIDIETFKNINLKLIDTISETLKIQREGRNKRLEAERELKNIETQFKNTVQAISYTQNVERLH